MIVSENSMSNSSGVTHIDYTSKSKFWFLQKMDTKLSYFLKKKIAVIQAKLFCVQKISKKNSKNGYKIIIFFEAKNSSNSS